MNDSKRARQKAQRGATMVSVMLLTVSLMTLGLLAVRSSTREVTQAGQLVARERALVAAQAALDLAASQYMIMDGTQLDAALVGYNPQGGVCNDPCGDCIPDVNVAVTGQRNEMLTGQTTSCGGRPCMRQGAVANLPDTSQALTDWCDLPLRDLVAGGDAEARVSVWLRNNAGDALGGTTTAPSWIDDNDGRVVITATATVRQTTVTVEQEILLGSGSGPQSLLPQSPDEGYGGGHNNDNSAVSVCADDYTAVQTL